MEKFKEQPNIETELQNNKAFIKEIDNNIAEVKEELMESERWLNELREHNIWVQQEGFEKSDEKEVHEAIERFKTILEKLEKMKLSFQVINMSLKEELKTMDNILKNYPSNLKE